jgi:hypothetical protein
LIGSQEAKLEEDLVARGLSFFSNIPHMADQWPDLGDKPECIKPVPERSTETCSLVLGNSVFCHEELPILSVRFFRSGSELIPELRSSILEAE